MAIVVNKETLALKRSVNTPDYSPDEWIINPVLPNCESKYWKILNNEVLEMTQDEKNIVDQNINDALLQAEENAKDIDNF